jgi:hypothetical protein
VKGLLFGLSLLLAAPSRAEVVIGVADEASVGTSQVTTSDPRTYYAADKLSALVEAGDWLALKLDFKMLHDDATATNAMQVALDADWTLGDHLSLDLRGDASPSSTSDAPTNVMFTDQTGVTAPANADLRSRTDSFGGGAGASIMMGRPGGKAETRLELSAGVEHFDTTQHIASVTTQAGQTVTAAQLKNYCLSHACSASERAVLAHESASVNQYMLSAGVGETLWRNTDLGVTGTLYLYDGDPTQLGYFSVATLGAALAPMQWSIRPDVSQRVGPFRLGAYFQYGEYVNGLGWSGVIGFKAQAKVSRSLKMWIAATEDVSSFIASFSFGARYYF